MAITGGARLPIGHDDVFPNGALVMGVEPMLKFQTADDKARGVPAQPETDKVSGLPMFAVTVIDQAAERKADAVVTVKIAASHQPVPPEAIPGTNLRPAIFEGLTLTPWIDDKACRPNPGERHRCRARLAYSIRATGMKPVSTATGGRSSKADATKAA
jgi:hypothetical protein